MENISEIRKLTLGVYDSPQEQKQPMYTADLIRTNIAVFGGPMSGKTNFIKNLLVRLHEKLCPELIEEEIYILDFGGAMGSYGELGSVCACFDNSNEENVKRIFKTVEKRVSENALKMGSVSFPDYLEEKAGSGERPKHITLIIENINTFLSEDRYSSYQELLMKLCRDGLSRGLCVIFTANDITGGVSRYLSNFGTKIAFEMPADKYADIFSSRIIQPMRLPGRGLATVNSVPYEFQCFMPFENERAELADFISETKRLLAGKEVEKLIGFARELAKDNFQKYSFDGKSFAEHDRDPKQAVVGLDYYEHKPVAVELSDTRSVAVYGKRQFGKTNLLRLLLKKLVSANRGARVVLVDDGRRQLAAVGEEIKGQCEVRYLTSVEELKSFLSSEGYHKFGPNDRTFAEKATPYTVFVLQNKGLYQANAGVLIQSVFPQMISHAEESGYMFIFADVRRVTDRVMETSLNNCFEAAFLLDSIGEFISDKGSRSVFGEMDARELKAEYARCELGDGFYYDIERDSLKKLKIVKY